MELEVANNASPMICRLFFSAAALTAGKEKAGGGRIGQGYS